MKQRLDQLVAEQLKISRSKAQGMIMAGAISIDGQIRSKAGQEFADSSKVVAKESSPYVSRGALKLAKAATDFGIIFSDKVIADIGASTGGFTDFALQHGAEKVYAMDCGYGQLDQKLRHDKRVVNMERTNIRSVESLPEAADIFVIDVSFISLKKVLPQVTTIIKNSKLDWPEKSTSGVPREIRNSIDVVALIKPQFEVGKAIADKYRGVITDEAIRQEVVTEIKKIAQKLGYTIKGVTDSPIKGAKGNKEFLIYLSY